MGFLGGTSGKEAASAGGAEDMGLIPGSGRFSGKTVFMRRPEDVREEIAKKRGEQHLILREQRMKIPWCWEESVTAGQTCIVRKRHLCLEAFPAPGLWILPGFT